MNRTTMTERIRILDLAARGLCATEIARIVNRNRNLVSAILARPAVEVPAYRCPGCGNRVTLRPCLICLCAERNRRERLVMREGDFR
ncbi:MAG: helix-turn-helix domain-containing protein [Planctomycetaceae bacterium]